MNRSHASLLVSALAVALCLSAAPASAQSASPITGEIGLEGIGLTDFGSFLSLPVGIRIGADYRVAEVAPGLSISVGSSAGWWMESFRDMFRFRPEIVPVMIPFSSAVGLLWEPTASMTLGVSAHLGFVLEWAPGAPPRMLLYVSPGVDARWFFTDHAGLAARLGWAWVGADPVWNGPSVKLGPTFR
jgi:hypothetical protein